MGAQFNEARVPKATSDNGHAAMEEWGRGVIEQAAYDYGHAGYSGSFAEADGVIVEDEQRFPDEKAAREWLLDNAEKWGPMVIVPYGPPNNTHWLAGCWCSS